MKSQPILSINQLSLSDSNRKLFQNISFAVSQGEIIAIMGPSGIGKSMLSKAIAGFLPSDIQANGSILLNGCDVVHSTILQRSNLQRPAVIFQDALKALNSLATVEQHLSLAATHKRTRLVQENRDAVVNLLSQLGFMEPESVLSLYPSQLSGGQRQRICIAVALLGHANLIIADEPTSALDPITEADILELLRNSIRGTNVGGILITHDLPAALECDKILVIADGSQVAYGPPAFAIRQSHHPFCQQLARLIP